MKTGTKHDPEDRDNDFSEFYRCADGGSGDGGDHDDDHRSKHPGQGDPDPDRQERAHQPDGKCNRLPSGPVPFLDGP